MARIRTIKPEFFRHEKLQELENKNKGKYPMLVFAGLWLVSDKSGRFEWRPKQLKLDILPFISFRMEESLELLLDNKFIIYYEIDGKEYGYIPTFLEHQRISGKEAQSPNRYPEPNQGSIREAPGTHPDAQEREREREKEREKERESVGRASKRAPHKWEPSASTIETLKAENPLVDLDAELKKFRDHTFKTARSDWDATFRNWVRNTQTYSNGQLRAFRPDTIGQNDFKPDPEYEMEPEDKAKLQELKEKWRKGS